VAGGFKGRGAINYFRSKKKRDCRNRDIPVYWGGLYFFTFKRKGKQPAVLIALSAASKKEGRRAELSGVDRKRKRKGVTVRGTYFLRGTHEGMIC